MSPTNNHVTIKPRYRALVLLRRPAILTPLPVWIRLFVLHTKYLPRTRSGGSYLRLIHAVACGSFNRRCMLRIYRRTGLSVNTKPGRRPRTKLLGILQPNNMDLDSPWGGK